jgi:hypothetical protein
MSDNVAQLRNPPSMAALFVAAIESGFHPRDCESFVREAHPHATEDEVYAAMKAAGDRLREHGEAQKWLGGALERFAQARERPLV